MDIKIPHSALTQFLSTDATPEEIAKSLSLCGPTVDKLEKVKDDDWVYHIEVITNRVDTASAYGIAREAHAILPEFEYKTQITNDLSIQSISSLGDLPNNDPVKVVIKDTSLVHRFSCLSFSNVTIKPSPSQTQTWLNLTDQRPIDNIVDISNELTLLYGQPVHVFDLDLIKGHTMIVRQSKVGEKISTLDGRTHTLKGGDIVIEDGESRLIDLCGIMGGDLSAVNPSTKNVLLFVQTYDPKHIRRTSLYTQERTLAAQLFEKQPDPEMVLPVLIEGAKLLMQRAGAKPSSKILDIYPHPYQPKTISLDPQWLNSFSGIKLPIEKMTGILYRLQFESKVTNQNQIQLTIPSYRQHDIGIKEDIAEEVMRVYGYYRLPSLIPPTTAVNTSTQNLLHHETKTRIFLSHTGFTEIYNYALIGEQLAEKAGVNLKSTYQLSNPLSEEYTSMRPTLLPSLLENLSNNRGLASPPHHLFELANVYDTDTLHHDPLEISTLSLIVQGIDYATFKGHLEALFKHLRVLVEITTTKTTPGLFDPQACAQLSIGKQIIGYAGRIKTTLITNFKLNGPVFGSELNFELLSNYVSPIHHFKPISQSPAIIEDLTFTLPTKTNLGPFIQNLQNAHPFVDSVSLKTRYEQNYTFTISYRDPDLSASKTLTDEEVAPARKQLVATALKEFAALLVGTV